MTPEQADVRYIKYWLDKLKPEIRQVTMGATQDNLSVAKLTAFKIPTPPVLVQSRIASVIAAYDDLIENNLLRIKILEEMMQNVYREWFIKFRFPGHKDVCIVDSPLVPYAGSLGQNV
ncbi:MAG: hypothetical protein GY807_07395 [Gammaproteobacteria bacterium]|nr:hypothetical protein [Gammaproteobacteria bacterium]